jgi:hypothetical protein
MTGAARSGSVVSSVELQRGAQPSLDALAIGEHTPEGEVDPVLLAAVTVNPALDGSFGSLGLAVLQLRSTIGGYPQLVSVLARGGVVSCHLPLRRRRSSRFPSSARSSFPRRGRSADARPARSPGPAVHDTHRGSAAMREERPRRVRRGNASKYLGTRLYPLPRRHTAHVTAHTVGTPVELLSDHACSETISCRPIQ